MLTGSEIKVLNILNRDGLEDSNGGGGDAGESGAGDSSNGL